MVMSSQKSPDRWGIIGPKQFRDDRLRHLSSDFADPMVFPLFENRSLERPTRCQHIDGFTLGGADCGLQQNYRLALH
jgi:hypothetical protein